MQGLDIETTALDPEAGTIALVQIKDDGVIDIYGGKHPDVPGRLTALEEPIAHNAPFERAWIRKHYDIDLGAIHDTMVMSQVLYGGTNSAVSPRFSHSLEAVARRELDMHLDKSQQRAAHSKSTT